MFRLWLFLLTATPVLAAEDAWTKVQELKSGSEIRIYKRGASQPLNAKLDQANEDSIAIVLKNEQVAIAKTDIDRIDARPAANTPRRLHTESKTATTDPDPIPHPGAGVPAPGTSSSTSVSIGGGKPEFETIYRRVAAHAPK